MEEEFEKLYDELRNESEKDNKKELNSQELENCKIKDESNYKGFLEDNDISEDLLNFLIIYNRNDLINSMIYHKNKAIKIFKEFLSFNKIKYKFNEDYLCLTKQLIEDFDSYVLIKPENPNFINILNNQQLNSDKIQKENNLKLIPVQSLKKVNKSFSKENFWFNEKNQRNILNLKDLNNSKKENNISFGDIKNKSIFNKSIDKKKDFIVEKIEESNSSSYEINAINFIKYNLFFLVLEKKVDFPETIDGQFIEELLQKVKIKKNKNICMKSSVKFNLVIKNLSKKELQIFIYKL